jgi:pimeloyl-ACP methyl ester carboxylesterase
MPRERPTAVPLDYEPDRGNPSGMWVLVLLLAGGVLGVLLAGFVLFARTTTTVTSVAALRSVPPVTEPPASRFVAKEGIRVILEQRSSTWLVPDQLRLAIDDITGGQVRASISDAKGAWLLPPTSLGQGEHTDFPDPDGAPLRLTLVRLSNVLVGEDEAELLIAPPDVDGIHPASRPARSEAETIELLLARVAGADGVVFIRNGDEHSAREAAEHLLAKWERAGGPEDPRATVQDFIEQVGSRSSLSGREYRVRLRDGQELSSAQWLRGQLREIEGASQEAGTRPATREATSSGPGAAQSVAAEAIVDREPSDALMNLALPTLGGKQLWTDVRIDPSGWRIQRNAVTGHHRLLDHRDRRLAWGAARECELAWKRQAGPDDTARRGDRELVVLLHGLFRTRSAMQPMADYLRAQGYDVIVFGYASTRQTIGQQAQDLSSVLSHLAGYRRVHFVGHSLGCLIVRQWLKTAPDQADPPIGRVVMLAPPNNGSQLAARLRRNPVFLLALGPAGQEIADWNSLEPSLATPADFGVIAGDCSMLGNPLLDAAGDLVVTLEETRLPGMRDFACVDATHTFLMRNPEVKRITLNFLRDGSFGNSP